MEHPRGDVPLMTPQQGVGESSPGSLLPPHYRVDRELGRGGMATVYLCTDTRDGKQVAAKILRPDYANAVAAERFVREVELVSRLTHPSIPAIIESGVTDARPYFVMRYVEGEPLRSMLDRTKRLAVADVIRIVKAVAEPIDFAHSHGIVHRDIKPDNLIVTDDRVFVLDFGIARAVVDAGGARLTKTGLTVGTPAYMSPEQAMGDRLIDQRSDVFSLGCVIYEMLAGSPPYAGTTPQAMIARRFTFVPPSLTTIREEVSPDLAAVVARALALAPADRFDSVGELANALAETLDVPAESPPSRQDDLLTRLRTMFAGSYEVEEEMRGGGMSRLFRATDVDLGREVVIKILPPDLTSPMMLARFKREGEVTARLQHPHILPVISAGVRDGLAYYIMPLVKGESLRVLLSKGRLPLSECLRILCEITDGLACAHERGVIHRDIKPENILINGGHAVLADFGIATALSGGESKAGERITVTGMSLGTVGYMAPEQALGDRNVDARADVYAAGVVGYEMVVGRPPFEGRSDQEILVGHLTREPVAISAVRPETPPALAGAITKALAKDPAGRFQSGSEFHKALTGVEAPSERQVPTAPTRGRRVGFARRPLALRLALVAAVLTIATAAGAYMNTRDREPALVSLDPKSVAILYIRAEGSDRELTDLADGLTEEIIASLDGITGMTVVSANGSRSVRSSGIAADSAARILGAGTVLDGTLQAAGDRLRLSVFLTDGSTGEEIDRARFDYPAGDALAMRQGVVRDVSELLRQRLGESVRVAELKASTREPQSWMFAQRGERLIRDAEALASNGDTSGASRQLSAADSLLALSMNRDRKWAEPLTLRGVIALRRSRMTESPAEMSRWADSALSIANAALAIEPASAAARELRATSRYWKWLNDLSANAAENEMLLRTAEEELRAVVRAHPQRATAWSVLSSLYANKADPVESAIAARRAYEADAYLSAAPDIIWRLYTTAYDNEQSPQAREWCSEGRRRFPANPRFAQCALWLLTLRDTRVTPDSAWKLVDQARAVTPPGEWEFVRREAGMIVAAALARSGLQDSARRVLVRSRGDAAVDPTRGLLETEAMVRVILGDREEALRLLKAYLVANPEHREGMAESQSWWWRDIRNDPEYREMAGAAH